MNLQRIIVLVIACAASGFIVWQDLPIEFPMAMLKAVMLFMKLFVVLALAAFAFIFAGSKRK